jgi:hypothetical protein
MPLRLSSCTRHAALPSSAHSYLIHFALTSPSTSQPHTHSVCSMAEAAAIQAAAALAATASATTAAPDVRLRPPPDVTEAAATAASAHQLGGEQQQAATLTVSQQPLLGQVPQPEAYAATQSAQQHQERMREQEEQQRQWRRQHRLFVAEEDLDPDEREKQKAAIARQQAILLEEKRRKNLQQNLLYNPDSVGNQSRNELIQQRDDSQPASVLEQREARRLFEWEKKLIAASAEHVQREPPAASGSIAEVTRGDYMARHHLPLSAELAKRLSQVDEQWEAMLYDTYKRPDPLSPRALAQLQQDARANDEQTTKQLRETADSEASRTARRQFALDLPLPTAVLREVVQAMADSELVDTSQAERRSGTRHMARRSTGQQARHGASEEEEESDEEPPGQCTQRRRVPKSLSACSRSVSVLCAHASVKKPAAGQSKAASKAKQTSGKGGRKAGSKAATKAGGAAATASTGGAAATTGKAGGSAADAGKAAASESGGDQSAGDVHNHCCATLQRDCVTDAHCSC